MLLPILNEARVRTAMVESINNEDGKNAWTVVGAERIQTNTYVANSLGRSWLVLNFFPGG